MCESHKPEKYKCNFRRSFIFEYTVGVLPVYFKTVFNKATPYFNLHKHNSWISTIKLISRLNYECRVKIPATSSLTADYVSWTLSIYCRCRNRRNVLVPPQPTQRCQHSLAPSLQPALLNQTGYISSRSAGCYSYWHPIIRVWEMVRIFQTCLFFVFCALRTKLSVWSLLVSKQKETAWGDRDVIIIFRL